MSKIIRMPLCGAALRRTEAEYVTEWSNYYRASRSLVDRATAISLADSHVAYLKKRDAETFAARGSR